MVGTAALIDLNFAVVTLVVGFGVGGCLGTEHDARTQRRNG